MYPYRQTAATLLDEHTQKGDPTFMAHVIYRRSIGTTQTLILNARNEWRDLRVCSVNGLGIVFVGFDRSLTAFNGYPLPANQSVLSIELAPGYQLFAIGTNALDEVCVFETRGGRVEARQGKNGKDKAPIINPA